ncbi:MAG: hypothetical protein J7556_11710 [Acidovorax sp.]|nr:hypothetical protein [Acidovorax sp.]
MTPTFSAGQRWLPRTFAAIALLALGACAPLEKQSPEYQAGRARVALPAGTWEDLGRSNEVIPLLPAGFEDNQIPLQTRAVGLRGAQKELLAVLLVQTNRTNYPREQVRWSAGCPLEMEVTVVDATKGSRVRADCLRVKHWLAGTKWLEKDQPGLAKWLGSHQIALAQPYTYVGYRYTTEGGALVVVDALVDHRLLRPKPRDNQEFLRSDQPAQWWSRELAQAARVSAGMMDGYLAIPPFPVPQTP